jgi:serine/threonine-protein kinase
VRAEWLFVLALLVVATGCGPLPESRPLEQWTIATSADDPGMPITLPRHVGPLVGTAPSFVLRSHVHLEPTMRGGPLSLTITWLPALVSLRADGEPVGELDHPLTDRFRSTGPHRWRIPDHLALRDDLDLELRVENAWTPAAWLDSPPRLSATPAGDAHFLVVEGFDHASAVAAFCTTALLCVLYFALYLRDRRRVQHGFFALEALGVTLYAGVMAGLTQAFLGRAEAAVVAVMFGVSAVAGVHFTNSYFGLPRPSRAWWLALALLAALAVVRAGPFAATTWVLPPAAGLILAGAAYEVGVFLRLRRAPTRPTNLAIITLSRPAAMLVGATDFALWLGLGDPFGGVRAGSLGIAAVAALQSLALAEEHVVSLRKAEQLNEELRHQVAARSRALADALARLGAGQPASFELRVGDRVESRYVVVRLLGEGASGRVYEVERLHDRQRFAMKVLTGTPDALALARAAREAQIASQVRHPNVVAVVDVDVSSDGYFFIVMELIAGRPLRDERARYGDAPWALGVLRQIALGLSAIHGAGIVHRDLKPANVLLSGGEGVVKIADFGISGVVHETPASPADPAPPSRVRMGSDHPTLDDPAVREAPKAVDPLLTQTGDLLGTPHYMAPEIVPEGAKAARSPADVFAFGVIAFELLAGRRPFDDMPTFVAISMSRSVPAFRSVCPSLPPATARLLDACLAIDPAERPTAEQLAEALSPAASSERTLSAR